VSGILSCSRRDALYIKQVKEREGMGGEEVRSWIGLQLVRE